MRIKKSASVGLALLAVLGLLLAGCAGMSREGYQGGAVGAGVGAAAGALLDSHNRWRGGVIGAALGAVLGGTLSEISSRAARDAAMHRQPVQYQSSDGRQAVYAEPYAQQGNCQLVREKIYQNGRLVKVQERRVCN